MTNLAQSLMSKDKLPEKKLGRSPLWFNALALLTTFTLGGWVAVELTQRLLQSIADRLVTAEAQAEILNALDHFLPYRIVFVGAALLLAWITGGAYLWLRSKSTLVISLTLAIPLMALCWFWVLRAPLAAPVAATSPTPTPAATRAPTTATPAATPTLRPLPAGKTQTYRNAGVGYEVDYPDDWLIDARDEASGLVIMWSRRVNGLGRDGVPADVVKIDLVNPAAPVQTLDEFVAWEKQIIEDASHTVLDEKTVHLPSGLSAVQLHVSGMGESLVLLTMVNRHPLGVAGYGDLSRFTAVVQTLRRVSPAAGRLRVSIHQSLSLV